MKVVWCESCRMFHESPACNTETLAQKLRRLIKQKPPKETKSEKPA